MNESGNKILADAAFASNENLGVPRGDARRRRAKTFQSDTGSNERRFRDGVWVCMHQ
jgi:hypothetical protein